MGRMLDGQWVGDDLGPDARGRYVRRAAKFRGRVEAAADAEFPAAAGRYRLYVAHACGWSHRTLLFRALKGLQDTIPVSYVQPFMGAEGWTLADGADPIHGFSRLYELYRHAQADYTGRASVPVLFDRERDTVVSNESSDFARDFNGSFGSMASGAIDLFPEAHGEAIDAMIAANYGPVNNGVYRAGFAGNQEAYEEAVVDLFRRLDELEAILERSRYLVGDTLTAADLCLFPTLYRFDTVYYIHFKCSIRQLRDYPNLWGFTRDIYQTPGVAQTCNMASTRQHYYTSHESIHPRRYVPMGPLPDFEAPHGRG